MKVNLNVFALFVCFLTLTQSQAQQVQTQAVAGANNVNAVSFRIDTLPAIDPNNMLRPRRFQAFWIPGDGNFIRYGTDGSLTTVEQDAESVAPPPYYYPAVGNYQAAAYLTGKYTNRKPPARAATNVNIGSVPANAPMPRFEKRLEANNKPLPSILDVFSNHPIRKNYLTTFVVSWPADVDAAGIYFFYNGFQNHVTGTNSKLDNNVMRYSNTEIPRYFQGNMDVSKIQSYTSDQLVTPGAVNGQTFNPTFSNKISRMFKDFIYYPAESVSSGGMPRGFTENRLFPVIWTDSILMPTDTLLNFYTVLTGSTPLTDNSPAYQSLVQMLNTINASSNPDQGPGFPGITPQTPIVLTSNQETLYIQAVKSYQLSYLATFDPNQLTVEDIKKTGADQYEVTFRLEMCNQGQAPVLSEFVDVNFTPDFQGFTPIGFPAINSNQSPGHWSFRVDTTISEIPPAAAGVHQDAECVAIFFKATTNCNGVRALWKNSPEKPVQSCVVFEGAMSQVPECHYSEGIDSTQFLVDGKCECCTENGMGTSSVCWPLWLLIFLVVALAVWWAYKQNNS